MSHESHVIIGAGQTGANAAVAMREAGFQGPILLVGDEPHLPYERPPLSKAALLDEPEPPPSLFFQPDRYAALEIELRLGVAAARIDPQACTVTLADGQELPFRRLLLATGGRARQLSVPGAEHVMTLRTLEDARTLRARLRAAKRVVCVGAGVIGLEVASSARALGCAVDVVEAGPRALGRSMPLNVSRWIERLHRDAGVRLHFGCISRAVTDAGVELENGTFLPADLVVAGIGMERDTALAEGGGVGVDRGVLVDALGRTNVPGIYAAGDVAAFWHPRLGRQIRLESWKHAQNHGIAVGRAMAGVEEPYTDVPWFWTDQHGVNVQVAGLVDDAVSVTVRGSMDETAFSVFAQDAQGRLAGAVGVNSPRDVRAALGLIQTGNPVDPAILADKAVNLQKLLRAA